MDEEKQFKPMIYPGEEVAHHDEEDEDVDQDPTREDHAMPVSTSSQLNE